MAALREFELEAIRLLVEGTLSAEQLEAVASIDELVSYEHTGCGYFVTVAHSALPTQKQTLGHPSVAGRLGDTECGFIVFLGQGELVLECYPSCGPDIPVNARDLPIHVAVEPSNVVDLR